MKRVALFSALSVLLTAPSAFAHTGLAPHVHPHPSEPLTSIGIVLALIVGAGLSYMWIRRK